MRIHGENEISRSIGVNQENDYKKICSSVERRL